MAYNRRRAGAEHEKMAGAYLEERGYRILEYNYRCKKGEIDIVAKDGDYLMEKGIADVPCRFDVAAILGKDVDLIKDAFQYRER